jgi:hypothetical protein
MRTPSTSSIFCLLLLCCALAASSVFLIEKHRRVRKAVTREPSEQVTGTAEASPAVDATPEPTEAEWTDPLLVNLRTTRLKDIAQGEGTLWYRRYRVSAYFDSKSLKSVVTVGRRGRILARLKEDAPPAWLRPAVQMALFRLLGKKAKQLIVVQDSGGAHCCYSLMIYDLIPRFRIIYDGRKGLVGETWDEIQFFDLNRNDTLEFKQNLLTFADAFEGLAYAASPRVPMFFKYYPNLGKYGPANHLFPAFALRGIANEKKAVTAYNANPNSVFSRDLLDIVLRLIYAGKERVAWSYFESEYRSQYIKKKQMKSDIRALLRKDPVYRFIYHP